MSTLWPKNKKGDKSKKDVVESMTKTENNGIQISKTSIVRQQYSMHSTQERTVMKSASSSIKTSSPMTFNKLPNTGRIYDFKTNMNDAIPVSLSNRFGPSPARSAFSSEPLTTSHSSLSPARSAFSSEPLTTSHSSNCVSKLQKNKPTSSKENEDLQNKLVVKVIKSKKFFDDQIKVPVYRTRSKNRGKLLLINNMKFIDEKIIRKGAELDEENVIQLFRQIGFEITKHRNLDKKEMENKIINFRNSNSLKKIDICTVVIMSHGRGKESSDSTEVLCTDGQLLETTWIINQFNSDDCGNLKGKPKIFIFQCCRGEGRDIQHDGIPIPKPRKLSDMLIAYSTVPGFVSHRDPVNGTWYIQAICQVFMEHAHDTDVENLLKIVDSKLSYLVNNGSKQTSSFENRGFKTCYLHPQLCE